MNCKTCAYPLWNLPGRTCPECGSAFKPSEFTFTVNTVAFCCPHCSQEYYGTQKETGHLEPREFDCVKCGKHIEMDEMVLRPAAGVDERLTSPQWIAWLERKRIGRYKGWRDTVTASMVRPQVLAASLGPEVRLGQAAWFAILTSAFIYGLGGFFCGGFGIWAPLMMAGGSPGIAIFGIVAGMCGWLAISLLMIILAMGAWGGIAHVILRMTGGTAHPYARTQELVFYSCGANALSAIPCLGYWFGWIWWLVSAVIMLKVGQQVSTSRAVIAGLAAQVAIIGVPVGSYALIILGMVGGSGAWSTQNLNTTQARVVAQALVQHASINGQWPAHAAELLGGSSAISPYSLMDTSYRQDVSTVTIAPGIDGMQFMGMTPVQQRSAIAAAAANLTPGWTAYRVGDAVFTYAGIPANSPDPRLWVVVTCPDPNLAANLRATPQAGVAITFGDWIVATADGSAQWIGAANTAQALTTQNAVRAQLGLPPLPDPSLVLENGTTSSGGATPPDSTVPEDESERGDGGG